MEKKIILDLTRKESIALENALLMPKLNIALDEYHAAILRKVIAVVASERGSSSLLKINTESNIASELFINLVREHIDLRKSLIHKRTNKNEKGIFNNRK